jgi:hypothetical protein
MTALRLADPIIHQIQPTPVCCTHTCVAMAVGIPVAELGADLNTAYSFDDCGIWFAERGIWMRRLDRSEPFRAGTLYLVSVRSRNKIGVDHALLLDTRPGLKHEDWESGWLTFDPNEGRDGMQTYSYVNEHYAIRACELKQRNGRAGLFGGPPE